MKLDFFARGPHGAPLCSRDELGSISFRSSLVDADSIKLIFEEIQGRPTSGETSSKRSESRQNVAWERSCVAHFDRGDLVCDGIEQTLHFQSSEMCASAEMVAATKGNVVLRIELRIEDLRVGGMPIVVIGGCVQDRLGNRPRDCVGGKPCTR